MRNSISDENKVVFGKKLAQLRNAKGLSQTELADALTKRLVKSGEKVGRIDEPLISKWENSSTDKEGRRWHPNQKRVLGLIEIFAEQLTLNSNRKRNIPARMGTNVVE